VGWLEGDVDGTMVGLGVAFPGRYVGSSVGERVGGLDGTLVGAGVGS